MDFQQELNLYIRSRYPILWIPTAEEERVEAEIAATAQQVNPPRAVLCWDYVDGYAGNNAARNNPLDALEQVARAPADRPALFVLRDFHEYLGDHSIRRKLRNVARQIRAERKTVIIVSPVLRVPPELEEDVTVVDFPFATPEQIETEMDRLLQGARVRLESGSKEALVKACLGLTLNRVRQVLAKALASHGQVDERDIALVLEEKKQCVLRTALLEFHPAQENMDDIGGLDVLKEWLRKRSSGFTERARQYGLPCPKGVLLVGIQGTGKSLCAKAVAQLWRLPLLRMDVGQLMGSLVGESEEKMRRAIRLAEAMAPCVLWVDEIDKAFAGVGSGFQGDSGTSARVFATFLTWMQEKTSPVFIACTANNIEGLPPELMRKGRIDEIFFVGLPSERERREIFQVHLRKRREHKLRDYDLRGLAAATEGYSGAEIEQAIISAMHDAFDENREFTDADILRAIRETSPLSRTAQERIEALKQWAVRHEARPASGDADLTPAAVGGTAPLEVDLPGPP